MAKLFPSVESDDVINQVEDLEVSPEEGEAAAVQAEAEVESDGVLETAEAIDAGADASAELEQVETLVEGAGEEGLTPVAAEAIRVAISVIASKVGANPQTLYQRYASENFVGAGASPANTAHALEGVQEFLKDLWKKIKAALNNLWTKLKGFWAKHLSNSGRMVKAIASMKNRVKSSSGKISGKAYLDKAPAAVAGYYKTTKDINATVVRESIFDPAIIQTYSKNAMGFAERIASLAKTNMSDSAKAAQAFDAAIKNIGNGSFELPVVGGEKVVVEVEPDHEEGSIKTTFTRELNGEVEESPSMVVADKTTLVSLLTDAEALIKAVTKHKSESEKLNQKFNEALGGVEKLLGDANLQGTVASNVRKSMRLVYKTAAVNAKIETLFINESIRCAKAVLTYSAACLKQYS